MTRSEYEYKWKQCHSSSEHVDVCEDYIKSLEQQLTNLKHNYEMQEIMIADYKRRIEELESPKTLHQVTKMTLEQAKELFKDCNTDFIINKLYDYFTLPYTKG